MDINEIPKTSCPSIPVIHRSKVYDRALQQIIEVLYSNDFDEKANAQKINALIDSIPCSCCDTIIKKMRGLLSQLILGSPATDSCVRFLIHRCKKVCSISSDLRNFPLHEMMIMWERRSCGPSVSTIKACISAFPEAVTELNGYGDTPLHALLATPNHVTSLPDIVRTILMSNPSCASIPNAKEKLPLHMIMKHYEPCYKTVALLVRAYPQGVVSTTVDEIVQLRFHNSSLSMSAVSSSSLLSSSSSPSDNIRVNIAHSTTASTAVSHHNNSTSTSTNGHRATQSTPAAIPVADGDTNLSSIDNATIINPTIVATPELSRSRSSSITHHSNNNGSTLVTAPVTTSAISEKKRVEWTPMSRCLEYGNVKLYQVMEMVLSAHAVNRAAYVGYL